MRTSVRIASCLASAGLVTAFAGATFVYAATTSAQASSQIPCQPTVSGSGPSIFVDPDYHNPLQSTVGYDTSDFSVSVSDPCIH